MHIFSRELSIVDRIQLSLSLFLRITVVIAIISSIFNQSWTVLFVSVLTLILTFLPSIIEKSYDVTLPLEFELVIVMFIYASIYLGEVHSYYTLFWWWDLVLHTGSGLVLGAIGFALLYILHEQRKIQTSAFLIAIFSFSFAVAMGAIWEIFEFGIDALLPATYMQESLSDTMWDLIVDGAGAFAASFMGYLYIKKVKVHLLHRMITRFVEQNPKLFAKFNRNN